MILKLSVNNQSVESSGITKDYKDALCEYVWNSFEANATAVAIDCKLKMDKEAIAAEIAQTAGDEKSKDTADALTALVAN